MVARAAEVQLFVKNACERSPSKVHVLCRVLSSALFHAALQALALVQLLVPLTSSLQALLSIKDLRTPLLLRVMLRPGVVLIAPLLTSSFLAGAGLIGRPVTAAGQVFAIVVGCIVSVCAAMGGCVGGGAGRREQLQCV